MTSGEPAYNLPTETRSVMLFGFGNTKLLKAAKLPMPVLTDGEVLVHVRACGVNFLDLMIRQGLFENLPKLPFVPGFECAGEIVQLGPNTTGYQLGERVICLPHYGAWTEYLAINSTQVYKMPDYVTFKDAAALSYNYLTAYILLFELGGVKSGQTLLFHSAGGGVGIALTQLCKQVNNLKVLATCSKHKFDALKHHCTHLFEENGVNDYAQEVIKVCPEGVDLVLDCLSGEITNRDIGLTKPLGKYILYGTAKNLEAGDGGATKFFAIAKNWWHVDKISPLKLYEDNLTICGFNLNNLLQNHNGTFNSRKYILEIYAKLFALYKDGKIKPVVDSVYSFENATNALNHLFERKNVGKCVLDPYFDEETSKIKIEKDRHSSDTSGPDDADEPEEITHDDLL